MWISHEFFGSPVNLEVVSTLCESESVNHSVMSDSWWPSGLKPSRLLCPWNSLNKNTGVVAISFFRASSQPRDWTEVSCIAGRFFTNWATREAHILCINFPNHWLALNCLCMVQSLRPKHRWPRGIQKDAQHCWSSEKYKSKPQWDVTSHLSEWLSSSMPQINVGEH